MRDIVPGLVVAIACETGLISNNFSVMLLYFAKYFAKYIALDHRTRVLIVLDVLPKDGM